MNDDNIRGMMAVVGQFLTDVTPPDLASMTVQYIDHGHEAYRLIELVNRLTKDRIIDGNLLPFGNEPHMQLDVLSGVHSMLHSSTPKSSADVEQLSANLTSIVHSVSKTLLGAAAFMVHENGGLEFDPADADAEAFLAAATKYQRDHAVQLLVELATTVTTAPHGDKSDAVAHIAGIDRINMVQGPSTPQ